MTRQSFFVVLFSFNLCPLYRFSDLLWIFFCTPMKRSLDLFTTNLPGFWWTTFFLIQSFFSFRSFLENHYKMIQFPEGNELVSLRKLLQNQFTAKNLTLRILFLIKKNFIIIFVAESTSCLLWNNFEVSLSKDSLVYVCIWNGLGKKVGRKEIKSLDGVGKIVCEVF